MAPKDSTSEERQGESMSRRQFDDDEENISTDDGDSSRTQFNRKSSKNWKQALIRRLKALLYDDSEASKKYRMAATAILTFAAISLYKRFQTQRGNQSRTSLSSLLPSILITLLQAPEYSKATESSLSNLRSAAVKGLVQRALLSSSEIVYQDRSSGRWRKTALPSGTAAATLQADLMEKLSQGGCSDISALPETFASKLASPAMMALPFVYLGLMYKILKNLHGGDIDSSSKNNSTLDHKGRTTFRDIAGLGSTISEVQELVWFLADPDRYQTLGAQPPRGVLLHGPPGSGKTLLARAVAGEANCDTFIACSGSDFCEMYVGRGAARVRSLFARARTEARRRAKDSWIPWARSERRATAVIFIDELDALAKSRSYGSMNGNDERDQTLNQLLTEMDGFPDQSSSDDVTMIVIAATNRAGECTNL